MAGSEIAVAVRSSATAEDLPEASFAGQQETLLNVRGRDSRSPRCTPVFASLFNDRAIAYRVHQGFDHYAGRAFGRHAAHGAQRSRRRAASMFTLDTDSGFRDVVFITAVVRPRRDRRAGRGQPRRVLRLQARAARWHASRSCGARSAARRSRWSTRTGRGDERVQHRRRAPEADRVRFSLDDDDLHRRSRGRRSSSKSTTAARWTSRWGKDGETGRDLHPAGASRDGAEPRRAHHPALHAEEPLDVCSQAGAASASASARVRRASSAT